MGITVFDSSTRMALLVVKNLELIVEDEGKEDEVDILVKPRPSNCFIDQDGLHLDASSWVDGLRLDLGIVIYWDHGESERVMVYFGDHAKMDELIPLAPHYDEWKETHPADIIQNYIHEDEETIFWASFANASEAAKGIWEILNLGDFQ